MKTTAVKSLEHLIELITVHKKRQFAIILAGGCAFSRKRMTYNKDKKTFNVFHCIDDVWRRSIPHDGLMNQSNIGKAIKNGAYVALDLT